MKIFILSLMLLLGGKCYSKGLNAQEYRINNIAILEFVNIIQDDKNDKQLDEILTSHIKRKVFTFWITEYKSGRDLKLNSLISISCMLSNGVTIEALTDNPLNIPKGVKWEWVTHFGQVSLSNEDDYKKLTNDYKSFLERVKKLDLGKEVANVDHLNTKHLLCSLWLSKAMKCVKSKNTKTELIKMIKHAFFLDQQFLVGQVSDEVKVNNDLAKDILRFDRGNLLMMGDLLELFVEE